jgi:hypothetical protein
MSMLHRGLLCFSNKPFCEQRVGAFIEQLSGALCETGI